MVSRDFHTSLPVIADIFVSWTYTSRNMAASANVSRASATLSHSPISEANTTNMSESKRQTSLALFCQAIWQAMTKAVNDHSRPAIHRLRANLILESLTA
jgi:hypothetical protein